MSIPKKAMEKFLATFNVQRAKAKLSPENAGGRLFPTRTTKNDKSSNFRADQGSQSTDDPETYWANVQANANASNTSVRKYAQKNPDEKLFSFPIKKGDSDEDVMERMRSAAKNKGYL
ncbi:hypothetical protein ACJ73_07899 [Blastomyces percursus]|uniref:Uncharacterized protein n=1 Tax=Blastomyces percursus TaxID=1658174 RepID=A0A1J9QY46_9EURO|nr:hypothetical protein ACJ73_07899 [Blastomyces percursus]